LTVVALTQAVSWLFYVSTAVASLGFGAAFLGALRTLVALATPEERSALVAAVYTVAYLAYSVPAIAAGTLSTHIGLHCTAVGYSSAVTALAVIALITTAGQNRAGTTNPNK
jgi:MFS family permease